MKRTILTLSFLLIYSTAFSQYGWVRQHSGISVSLNNLYFINENTGWVAGDSGRILHTTNGGTNWILQNSNTTRTLSKVIFLNANTGIVTGDYYIQNPWCMRGAVTLTTSDGGTNWNVLQDITSSTYITDLNLMGNNYYASLSGTEMQCIMSTGRIAISSNYGINWDNFNAPADFSYGYNSICFINASEGWAIREFSSDIDNRIQIIKTTNAGVSWENAVYDTTNVYSCNTLRFLDSQTGYMLKGYPVIWSLAKSTDGGANWNYADSNTTSFSTSFSFVNNYTGWCVGWEGKIIRTNNGGMNWTYQNSTVTNRLNSVQFVNSETGYIAGRGGLILKTGNGGLTSVAQPTSIPSSFILEQNFPNPFNPSTVIRYSLQTNTFVTLKIYDVLGAEVSILVNKKQNAGNYEVEFNAETLGSGIYFYKIEAGDFSYVKKMLLVK